MSRTRLDDGLAQSISPATYRTALEVLIGLTDLQAHEVLMLLHHVDPHAAFEQRLAETMKGRGGEP